MINCLPQVLGRPGQPIMLLGGAPTLNGPTFSYLPATAAADPSRAEYLGPCAATSRGSVLGFSSSGGRPWILRFLGRSSQRRAAPVGEGRPKNQLAANRSQRPLLVRLRNEVQEVSSPALIAGSRGRATGAGSLSWFRGGAAVISRRAKLELELPLRTRCGCRSTRR
jgi:hypothetical protein